MHFEYEITPEEYIAAQILYHKVNQDRTRLRWIAYSFFTAFLCVAWSDNHFGWPQFFLVITGVLWIYVGFSNLFPPFLYRHFNRAYKGADLAGKKFQTDMGEDGFEVTRPPAVGASSGQPSEQSARTNESFYSAPTARCLSLARNT